MRLKDILLAPKEVVDLGNWQSGKLMPNSAFPLFGKTKLVRKPFTWKVIKFKCLGEAYRVLVFYRLDKQAYYCWLARDTRPLTLLAKYEYHATHRGWHLHGCCKTEEANPGRTKGHFGNLYSRHLELGISNEREAHDKAIRAFRLNIQTTKDDLFQ